MPTPKTMDDIPLVGTNEGVSALQYVEARLRDSKEHSGLEIQGLREMFLRFREDAANEHKAIRGATDTKLQALQDMGQQRFLAIEKKYEDILDIIDQKLDERDVRYQQRFDAQSLALNAAMLAAEKAIGAALLSAEKAVTKAELASENRFASVNEFRAQLGDQTATFIPRAEATARFDSLAEKLDSLSSRIDKSEGKGTGLNAGWAILVSIIGIVGTISAIVVALIKLGP